MIFHLTTLSYREGSALQRWSASTLLIQCNHSSHSSTSYPFLW